MNLASVLQLRLGTTIHGARIASRVTRIADHFVFTSSPHVYVGTLFLEWSALVPYLHLCRKVEAARLNGHASCRHPSPLIMGLALLAVSSFVSPDSHLITCAGLVLHP